MIYSNDTTTYTMLDEFPINGSGLSGNSSTVDHDVSYSQRDSLCIIIPMTLCYIIIFISGVVGNVSTCIVIFYNNYMHTATNFYLFSLAVSDLLLLLAALPKEVYELWFRYSFIFGEVSCVLQGFASESAANATVLTITAFTIERYVAICHPFMSQTVSKLSRAVKHIVIIWIMALCLAIPQAVQFGIDYKSDQSIECTVVSSVMDHSFEISSLVFFMIPTCIISVLYILIGFRLRSSRLVKQVSARSFGTVEQRISKNQGRVIRMLVAVVVAFIICWAPFHAQRLLAIYGLRSQQPSNTVLALYSILTYISGILYYLSATINPILYNIMSNKFRRAFKLTFGHLCGCCITKRQRNKHLIRSRSFYTCRINDQYQTYTPRSSLSQKEEIPLHNHKLQNGVVNKRPSIEGNIAQGVKLSATLVPAEGGNKTGKLIKKDRSPIVAIKARLHSMKPSSPQTKTIQHQFRSTDDLHESKFTDTELLRLHEQFDETLLLQ